MKVLKSNQREPSSVAHGLVKILRVVGLEEEAHRSLGRGTMRSQGGEYGSATPVPKS
jgi:hypothetical protein